MFWLYLIVAVFPAVCFYLYINRDGDAWTEGMTASIFILFVQSILYLVGGTVFYSLAALIFAFAVFLGYGAWFMKRLEQRTALPIGKHILFDYRDWKFRFSKRRLKVESFDNKYITGFCETRQAERTFRRDRIQNGVIVEETGEIIDPMAPAFPEMHKK